MNKSTDENKDRKKINCRNFYRTASGAPRCEERISFCVYGDPKPEKCPFRYPKETPNDT